MTVGVVNIRGKEYQTVPLRVSLFRRDYGSDAGIVTEVIENTENRVVVKATIFKFEDAPGGTAQIPLATGYAEEFRAASTINKTSAMENAETSAVGRALAFLGYAGDGALASAEELQNALAAEQALVGK